MKVERSSSLETSSRHRRQEWVVRMEFTVRANEDGDEGEKVAAAGGEYRVSTSAGRESSNLTLNEGEGLYKLTRHKSAVFEHDFRHYANSLNRTSSEVRDLPMQLGLQAHDQKDCRKDVFGIGDTEASAVTVESQKSDNKELLSHSPSLKIGQLEKFVYKNYSLHGRRTASLPVGKEHAHKLHSGQSWKVQGCKEGTATSSSFTFNGLSHVQSRKQQRELIVTQENDFDKEAEKRSKSLLFFQGVHTLFTIAITLLSMYLCICFLTSVPRITAARYNTPANGSGQGEEEEEDSDFSHARLFARASSSLLGMISAGVVIVAGMWMSDVGLWKPPQEAAGCSHCADVGAESHNRVEQADKKVLQAERAKQQFMAYVFHNIRVPFNAIVLGLGHMRATGEGFDTLGLGDKMDLIQMMLDCAETMTSVLDNVTDMGQWEVGQVELHREEFDILTVVRFLSWSLKDLLEQKQITFNMTIDDKTNKLLASHHVVGDKQRIVQTLGNFLSNGIKFMPAGGKLDLDLQCEEVTESKELDTLHLNPLLSSTVPVAPAGGSLLGAMAISVLAKTVPQGMITNGKVARIQFSVKDNGIGISAEDQVKLFEPYSFVTSGWVQEAGVSGLGLSMAKRYIEGVGGTIGVESTEGEGSTFFFSVPFPLVPFDPSIDRAHSQLYSESSLALLEKAELSSSLSSSAVIKEPTTDWQLSIGRENPNTRNKEMGIDVVTVDSANFQRKVLLVEDTHINRIILRKVLQNLNLQCDEAENGQVAVDYYKQGKTYDLVLMDKEMPVMDGHEATRQLRLMGVKTPIIALTGNALQSDRDLFFEAGVDDFQTKPLSRDKLVQLLVRYGVENSCSKSR